jgi:DNA-binding NarL/FixJ family response regulator
MEHIIRVTLTDDHVLFRKGLASIIREFEGVELVAESGNGKELIDQVAQLNPDVALIDLNMPVMDGIRATAYLKEHFPLVRVIIVSMIDQPEYIVKLIRMGANGYLLKNAEPAEVEKAIKQVYSADYYFNERTSAALLDDLLRERAIHKAAESQALSTREIEIIQLICKEQTNQEIATQLGISPRTVEAHRRHIMEKIGAKNTAGLILYGLKHQLISA